MDDNEVAVDKVDQLQERTSHDVLKVISELGETVEFLWKQLDQQLGYENVEELFKGEPLGNLAKAVRAYQHTRLSHLVKVSREPGDNFLSEVRKHFW